MDTLSLETWLEHPHNRESFHQVDRLLQTATIAKGDGRPRSLNHSGDSPLGDESIVTNGPHEQTLEEFLDLTHTDSIVVLRGDDVLYERYFDGNTTDSRHIAMSVSKSLCGMLAGILVGDGKLDVNATASAYIPELARGSWGDATVRELLDMTAAPNFDMNYTGPNTEVQAGDRSAGWRPGHDDDADGTRAFLEGIRGSGTHGNQFQYCSATTDVLAWVIERAANRPYRELLADLVWSKIGAEEDAFITIDDHGTPYACAGVNMRLRDLARFGRLILGGGMRTGEQVVPVDWIASTAAGGEFNTMDETDRSFGTYKNQWWVPRDADGCFYAVGIFGQYLWLDPARDITIAKFSSEENPLDHGAEHVSAFLSIGRIVDQWAPKTTIQRETINEF
jgi:CubicO group peptidase (beta-lactamase class C family)